MQTKFLSDDFPESQTMATSETLEACQHGFVPEACPANPQAWPASDEARKMTVGSGRRLLPLLRTVSTNGSCLRTLMESCLSTTDWNSSVSVLRWKLKATKFNRLLFQLAPLALRTEETESGLLPTPSTVDSGSYLHQSDSSNAAKRPTLGAMAKYGLWPTPRSEEHTS